jgi:hypothetical protein
MDIMLLGETFQANAGEGVTGFWMPAGGNNGVAAVEVFYVSAASVFDVIMETKSSDQADSSAAQIGSVTISSTTPGVQKFDVADAKDLVRYRVGCSDDATQRIHFQFAQPLWAPN